jgi:hypothetical protein
MDPVRRPLISLPSSSTPLPSPRHRYPLTSGFTIPAPFKRHAILVSFLLGMVCFGLLHSSGVVSSGYQLGVEKLRTVGNLQETGSFVSPGWVGSVGWDEGEEEAPSPEVVAAVAAAVEDARQGGESGIASSHPDEGTLEKEAKAATSVEEALRDPVGRVAVHTLPKHDAAFHPRPGTRYMSYLPHSGSVTSFPP